MRSKLALLTAILGLASTADAVAPFATTSFEKKIEGTDKTAPIVAGERAALASNRRLATAPYRNTCRACASSRAASTISISRLSTRTMPASCKRENPRLTLSDASRR